MNSHKGFRATSNFTSLDGLRCLSILAVTGFHTGLPGAERWGNHGVTLFFAISGFLITTLLLRERDEWGDVSLRHFWVRRGLRIFPLYFAALAVYAVLIATTDHTERGREFFANVPYFLTYTSNWFVRNGAYFFHSWTLSTEEQFYVVWPVALVLLGRANRFAPLAFVIVVMFADLIVGGLVNRGAVDFGAAGNRAATSVQTSICLGCVLAYALHHERSYSLAAKLLSGWGAAVVVASVAALLYCNPVPRIPIEVALACLVGVTVIRERSVLSPLLSLSPLRYVGKISYGLYLFNTFSFAIAKRFTSESPVPLFLGTLAVAVALCSVSYYGFERPILKLKSRWGTRREQTSPLATGASLTPAVAP